MHALSVFGDDVMMFGCMPYSYLVMMCSSNNVMMFECIHCLCSSNYVMLFECMPCSSFSDHYHVHILLLMSCLDVCSVNVDNVMFGYTPCSFSSDGFFFSNDLIMKYMLFVF